VAALNDEDTGQKAQEIRVRAKAVEALGRIGWAAGPAVPQLTQMLEKGDGYSKQQAALALWLIKHDASLVVPTLSAKLSDPDAQVRQSTALTLSRIALDTDLGSELKARIAATRPPAVFRTMARSE